MIDEALEAGYQPIEADMPSRVSPTAPLAIKVTAIQRNLPTIIVDRKQSLLDAWNYYLRHFSYKLNPTWQSWQHASKSDPSRCT